MADEYKIVMRYVGSYEPLVSLTGPEPVYQFATLIVVPSDDTKDLIGTAKALNSARNLLKLDPVTVGRYAVVRYGYQYVVDFPSGYLFKEPPPDPGEVQRFRKLIKNLKTDDTITFVYVNGPGQPTLDDVLSSHRSVISRSIERSGGIKPLITRYVDP